MITRERKIQQAYNFKQIWYQGDFNIKLHEMLLKGECQ
jgi:hypothetical protein